MVFCPPQPCSVCSRDIPARPQPSAPHPSLQMEWVGVAASLHQPGLTALPCAAGGPCLPCPTVCPGPVPTSTAIFPSQETHTAPSSLMELLKTHPGQDGQSHCSPAAARSIQLSAFSFLSFLSSFFHFYSPSSAEPKHFGDSALGASLLFTEPPISLLQDAAWIRPITSSLDV